MSETEIARNDDGTFAAGEPDTTGLFGREEALVKGGYTLPPKADQPEETGSDEESLRQAADRVAAKRGEPEIPLTPSGVLELADIDPKIALTVEQAAELRTAARGDIARFTDSVGLDQLAADIDAKRAEVIKGDPKVAKELGVEVPKDPALTKAEQAEAAEIDAMDGLDPETRKALKSPQIRQAIEQEFTKAEAAQKGYAEALNTANQFAMANLVDHFPELGSIPAEQWEPALNILAQQDPQRFDRAMGVLQRVSQLQTAQQQWQQQQAQVQHQQFEAVRQQYSRASDAALGPMTMAEKSAMAEELVSYVGEYGVSREQFMREAETNLALHHPAFQRMAADAVKYQRLMKSPAKAAPKSLPPVQKPGSSAAPRASDNSSKLQALQNQLASATGDKALRLAGQIRNLKRAS